MKRYEVIRDAAKNAAEVVTVLAVTDSLEQAERIMRQAQQETRSQRGTTFGRLPEWFAVRREGGRKFLAECRL